MSPALLLNHMAERYPSTSRILMEFVDNAFDDAEALFELVDGSRFAVDVLESTYATLTAMTSVTYSGLPSARTCSLHRRRASSHRRGILQCFCPQDFPFAAPCSRTPTP